MVESFRRQGQVGMTGCDLDGVNVLYWRGDSDVDEWEVMQNHGHNMCACVA